MDVLSKGTAKDFPHNKFNNIPFYKSILSLKNLKVVLKIKSVLKKESYDYIVLNTSLTAALVRLAIPFNQVKKIKVINICHGYFFGVNIPSLKSFIFKTIEKVLSRRTDYIITMNSEDFGYAKDYKLCKNEAFFVHGMGYNKDKYSPKIKSKRNDDKNINLLYVAEHSERKNHNELLLAMKKAVDKGAKLNLYLAGDGKLMEENERLSKDYGILDRVFFLGYISEVKKVYATCDYVVSPSKIEGLPFNIMEALACGLPCVVSDIKGHRDLVKDNKNGYIYNQGDIDKLAEILESLEVGTKKYNSLSSKASTSVLKNSLPQTLSEFKEIYKSIIGFKS